MKRILIKNGYIASMDPDIGDIIQGDVLVDGDKIVAVGKNLSTDGAEVVDATDKLVMPGMIDTHRHTWQTQMRGICSEMTLIDYMNTIRLAISPSYTAKDVYIGNKLGALEAINAGVTTILDFSHCNNTPEHSDAAVNGLIDSGIRALFSYGFFDSSTGTGHFSSHDDRIKDYERIVDTYRGKTSRLTFGVALTKIGLLPWDKTVAEIDVARRTNGRIAVHTGCFWGSAVTTGIKELHAAGLLGPDHVHIHGTTLDEEDWRCLSSSGSHVSIAVETELNMGMGWPAFKQCCQHGIKPTLSCDVISLNSGDLLTQMRMGLAAYRFADNDVINREGAMPHKLTATSRDAFEWVTVNGAVALGLEDRIGSLSPGKQADIVIIGNPDSFTGQRAINPLGSAIFQSNPSDILDVFIDGVRVKKDGRLVNIDLKKTFAEANDSAQTILDKVYQIHPVLPPPVDNSDYLALETNAKNNIAQARP